MTAVTVAQLVYSNVEAEHSPTNRRGFQVWLSSPGLRDRQREIARRLEDFDWPTPDAAVNRITERLIFFRTAAGDAVAARTVPLTERDALNRAGRFHAHALVLTLEQFARIGNNPFALFDHFKFQDHPAPLIESGAWQRDDPFGSEPVPIGPPAAAVEPDHRLVARLLPEMVRWLDRGDDPRPVAIPAPPERVAGFLRAVFEVLPPTLRLRATFDTLSTGQSLGTLPYAFAGGYDLATVRDWAYRRSYRLDLETGEFAPGPQTPPDAALETLAVSWAAEHDLTDADREASYHLTRALREHSPDLLPATVSKRSLQLARAATGREPESGRLLESRLASDLPAPSLRPLITKDAARWLGPFGFTAIERLRAPLPAPKLIAWLRAAVDRAPLTAEQAGELEAWTAELLAGQPEHSLRTALGELLLIARRWGPDAPRRLRELLADPDWSLFAADWLPRWFLESSREVRALTEPGQFGPIAESLFSPAPADPRTIDDAEILLTIAPDAVPPALKKHLQFLVALRRGDQSRMEDLLEHPADRPAFLQWVYHHVVRYGWRAEFALGNADGGQHAGVLLRPAAGDPGRGRALLAAVAEDSWCRRQLFDWQVHAPPPGLAQVEAEDRPVANALIAYRAQKWDRLRDLLGELTPAEFGWVVNATLADKVLVHRHAMTTDHGVWLGLVPVSNGVHGELFAGTYGAVIAAVKADPDRAPVLTHATLYALNRR